MKGIWIGVLGTLLLGAAGAALYVSMGWMPANADSKPGKLERWMARKSLRATFKRIPPQTAPIAPDEANLAAGVKLYAANCLVCHGASDGKPSNIARGLYQKAPQFARHGVDDDPEEKIEWIIEHGIRLTGMPAFGPSLNQTQLWQLTLFLKHMDALPPKADKAWKALASVASPSAQKPEEDSSNDEHAKHEHHGD